MKGKEKAFKEVREWIKLQKKYKKSLYDIPAIKELSKSLVNMKKMFAFLKIGKSIDDEEIMPKNVISPLEKVIIKGMNEDLEEKNRSLAFVMGKVYGTRRGAEKGVFEKMEKFIEPKKKRITIPIESSNLTERQTDILEAIMRRMSQKSFTVKEVPEGKITEKRLKRIKEVYPRMTAAGWETKTKEKEIQIGTRVHLLSLDMFKKLKDFLESYNEGVEIEIGIGYYVDGKFRPGVTDFVFEFLENNLKRMEIFELVSLTNDKVDILEGSNLRKITFGEEEYIQEKKRGSDIIKGIKYGIKISRSLEGIKDSSKSKIREFEDKWEERQMDAPHLPSSNEKLCVTRYRSRRSFLHKSQPYRIDLTRVKEEILFKGGRIETYYKNEVEIEVTGIIKPYELLSGAENLLSITQLNTPLTSFLSNEERGEIIKYHNSFFSNKKGFGYRNEPRNISLFNMFSPEFENAVVTIKLNGKRMTIISDGKCWYSLMPGNNIFRVGDADSYTKGTVLDCEFMETLNKIYAFDILFDKNDNVQNVDFMGRRNKINDIIRNGIELYGGKRLIAKVFETTGNIYDKIRNIMNQIDSEPYKSGDLDDGLLIQTIKNYNSIIWKWKPIEKLTIDFLLKKMTREENREQKIENGFWLLLGEGKGKTDIFRGSHNLPFSGWLVLENGLFQNQNPDNKVVECKWEVNKFVPVRYRSDKPYPNAMRVGRGDWKDIHNPITKKTIQGYDMRLMRKLHMEAKQEILRKYFTNQDILADLGSGRGGTINLWNEIGIKKVYAIEPDEEYLNIFEERYDQLKKENPDVGNYEMINSGAEYTAELKPIIGDLTGITAFFSLTFFPESKEKYVGLLNTISLIPVDGIFAGIVMDGALTMSLLEEQKIPEGEKYAEYIASDAKEPIIENTAFEIKQLTPFEETQVAEPFENSTTNRLKVEIYDETSMVKTRDLEEGAEELEKKEYTEWLFFFDIFQESLENRGFELVENYLLDHGEKYEALPNQSKVFSGLNRAFVFKRLRNPDAEPKKVKPKKVEPKKKQPAKKAKGKR